MLSVLSVRIHANPCESVRIRARYVITMCKSVQRSVRIRANPRAIRATRATRATHATRGMLRRSYFDYQNRGTDLRFAWQPQPTEFVFLGFTEMLGKILPEPPATRFAIRRPASHY